jgi:hypothetical protein
MIREQRGQCLPVSANKFGWESARWEPERKKAKFDKDFDAVSVREFAQRLRGRPPLIIFFVEDADFSFCVEEAYCQGSLRNR